MVSLADYFAKNRYQPVYQIGDRVFGKYNKTPFIGTVGNDTVISELEGPQVSVHLDLPMKIGKEYKTLLILKHKDIKSRLVEY